MTVSQKLLVEQVVCVKNHLLATNQDDLGVLPQIVVFQLPDEPHSSFLSTLQGSKHFVVNHRVKSRHQSALLFFHLKLFDRGNVFEAEDDA